MLLEILFVLVLQKNINLYFDILFFIIRIYSEIDCESVQTTSTIIYLSLYIAQTKHIDNLVHRFESILKRTASKINITEVIRHYNR